MISITKETGNQNQALKKKENVRKVEVKVSAQFPSPGQNLGRLLDQDQGLDPKVLQKDIHNIKREGTNMKRIRKDAVEVVQRKRGSIRPKGRILVQSQDRSVMIRKKNIQ